MASVLLAIILFLLAIVLLGVGSWLGGKVLTRSCDGTGCAACGDKQCLGSGK